MPPADLSAWRQVVNAHVNPDGQIDIAMVGKYVQIRDSYISLNEALMHAGLKTRTRVKVHYIESTDIESDGVGALAGMDAILVPGGFGERGIEGKIQAVRYAREQRIPVPRHLPGDAAGDHRVRRATCWDLPTPTAPSSIAPRTHPVIALITEWQDQARGMQQRDEGSHSAAPCAWVRRRCTCPPVRAARELYGRDEIMERHRHRYEFNNTYLDAFTRAGL